MTEATKELIKDILNKVYGERCTCNDSSLVVITDLEIWLINYLQNYKIEKP